MLPPSVDYVKEGFKSGFHAQRKRKKYKVAHTTRQQISPAHRARIQSVLTTTATITRSEGRIAVTGVIMKNRLASRPLPSELDRE